MSAPTTLHVTITGVFASEHEATTFVDAFNEWARHPEIDVLFVRTDNTPSGYPESDYRIASKWEPS